jgi:CHAD domain-containing protein
MAFELTAAETIAEGVRRCAREQLDGAIQALDKELESDPVEAVHSARKAIKKERALLRLARGSLPRGQRIRDDARLRDVGRTLSGARDADVMLQTVENLGERFRGELPESTFAAVRTHLLEAATAHGGRDGIVALAQAAIGELTELRAHTSDWGLGDEDWDAIRSGLRRTYRRGREAFRIAAASRSTEDLHAWRRRVKDHWYHLRLLTASCGPIVGGAAQEADRLSDVLGEDHDLSVLSQVLSERSGELEGIEIDPLMALIDRRRGELQVEAWQIGGRLYVEKPRRFERRLRGLWKAGQVVRNLRPEVR